MLRWATRATMMLALAAACALVSTACAASPTQAAAEGGAEMSDERPTKAVKKALHGILTAAGRKGKVKIKVRWLDAETVPGHQAFHAIYEDDGTVVARGGLVDDAGRLTHLSEAATQAFTVWRRAGFPDPVPAARLLQWVVGGGAPIATQADIDERPPTWRPYVKVPRRFDQDDRVGYEYWAFSRSKVRRYRMSVDAAGDVQIESATLADVADE